MTGWVEQLGIGHWSLALIVRLVGLGARLPRLVERRQLAGSGRGDRTVLGHGPGRAGPRADGAGSGDAPAGPHAPGAARGLGRPACWPRLVGQRACSPPTRRRTRSPRVYLVPLILVVGIRMLPRVSAYPIRFPKLCGALVWAGLLGGVLRAFGGLFGSPVGWQLAWLGGSVVTLAVAHLLGACLVTVGRADRRSARAGDRSARAPHEVGMTAPLPRSADGRSVYSLADGSPTDDTGVERCPGEGPDHGVTRSRSKKRQQPASIVLAPLRDARRVE